MPSSLEISYNGQMFRPPAPVVEIEVRSPANLSVSSPEQLPALIDSGADGSVIPEYLVHRLNLAQVGGIWVGGYDDSDEDLEFRPVYSIHFTIGTLEPFITRVIPRSTDDYITIGRNVINDWILTLDGPKRKTYLKLTI